MVTQGRSPGPMFTPTRTALLAALFAPAPHYAASDGRTHDGGAEHATVLAAAHTANLLAATNAAPHRAVAGLDRPHAWTGYPMVPASAWRLLPLSPSATAWLGSGVWLRHQADPVAGAWLPGTVRNTLTVVAPCDCGSVRERICRDVFALAAALDAAFAADRPCDGSCPRRDARLRGQAARLTGNTHP
ncbi:hypothetical protein [Streptodolium elevatio]